jgi:hypothetical protein
VDRCWVISVPFGVMLTRELMAADKDCCTYCELYPMTKAIDPVVLILKGAMCAAAFCCADHARAWARGLGLLPWNCVIVRPGQAVPRRTELMPTRLLG